ncbi:acetamidase [Pycnococcus provasolii]
MMTKVLVMLAVLMLGHEQFGVEAKDHMHTLKATADTVHWGFFSKDLKPKLTIDSGDIVNVEMLSHHAGDDPDLMIKGDSGVESVYEFPPGKTVETHMRGMTGKGDGVHILTGPIFVTGAEPGDVIEVDILELTPRENPQGKAYGSNAAAWWGYDYGINGPESKPVPASVAKGKQIEVATIYEAKKDASGKYAYAEPVYQMTYGGTPFSTVCVNDTNFNPGVDVPCVDGKQTWSGYYFPGLKNTQPATDRKPVTKAFQVPLNLHIGCMGLAPAAPAIVDSVPPMPNGGNLDNRRIGVGAKMYYPVKVAGGLLSMGDTHLAQGDSELDGTGIEASVNGKLKITLHKKASLPAKVKSLPTPLIESSNEFVVHGFTFDDYITELGYDKPNGPDKVIYFESDINKAMVNAYENTRDFIMAHGYTESEARTLITTSVDFATTQLVDGNWGMHGVIPKYVFEGTKKEYMPATKCGTSMSASPMVEDAPSAPAPKYTLKATADTVHWGFFSKDLKPKLTIDSGDVVMVEMLSHHAGDDPDLMIKGDSGVESVYEFPPGKTVETHMRGMTGKGDGVHILTGPIFVTGAEPGDVIEVDILELTPRENPQGKAYGSNAAAWWGYDYGINGPESKPVPASVAKGKQIEVATIYEAKKDASGKYAYAEPVYQMTYGGTPFSTVCVNDTNFNPGVDVPCVDGKQTWSGYYFPGLKNTQPATDRKPVTKAFQVPLNLHIGCMGLAPAAPAIVDSVPPMPNGGNLDNRRIGVGAKMYYPVKVAGGLLSMGDTHLAQGDSELDGTGIEASVNGKLKITLHKKASLPAKVKSLPTPLIESSNEFVVHGFTFDDYITELGYDKPNGPDKVIYFESDINKAMVNAYENTRDFIMAHGYTESEARTLITTSVDFATTQLVDGNWGMHGVIPKYVFEGTKKEYMPATKCGTSMPVKAPAAVAAPAPPPPATKALPAASAASTMAPIAALIAAMIAMLMH